MSFESEIFEGKTLSDMFADVYSNTESKRQKIREVAQAYIKLVRTPEDAAVLGPVIQSLLESEIKNDEHIVRLVQIAQRLVSVNSKSSDTGLLTEEEKMQLLNNVKDDFEAVFSEQEDLQSALNSIEE
jgi:hypothetical protein